MKTRFIILFIILGVMLNVVSVSAQGPVNPIDVGQMANCGNLFKFSIVNQPIVTASQSLLVADGNLKYLVMRVDIQYLGEEFWNGFADESFWVEDIYKEKAYNSYPLDGVVSAIVAGDWALTPFYTPIVPLGSRQTYLIFEVYPNVDSWDLHFEPQTRDNKEPVCQLKVRIPKVKVQQ